MGTPALFWGVAHPGCSLHPATHKWAEDLKGYCTEKDSQSRECKFVLARAPPGWHSLAAGQLEVVSPAVSLPVSEVRGRHAYTLREVCKLAGYFGEQLCTLFYNWTHAPRDSTPRSGSGSTGLPRRMLGDPLLRVIHNRRPQEHQHKSQEGTQTRVPRHGTRRIYENGWLLRTPRTDYTKCRVYTSAQVFMD